MLMSNVYAYGFTGDGTSKDHYYISAQVPRENKLKHCHSFVARSTNTTSMIM